MSRMKGVNGVAGGSRSEREQGCRRVYEPAGRYETEGER